MVKFGKEYRKYQVNQWKESYINYKRLKQEIKAIKNNIEEFKSRKTNSTGYNDLGHPSIQPIQIFRDDSNAIEIQDLQSLYNLRFGNELKRFIDLLKKEFRKCYIHFVNQEKELYKRVNTHCYSNGVYKDYNILNIYNEIKEIGLTMKLAKQLNCFVNDNVMALKKILKKFDKKFQTYFGIITPKYLLTHLTSQNSDLEYLLQFKLIDESTTICDNNLNILLNLYKKLRGNNINSNPNNNQKNINNINNNNSNEGKKVNNLNNLDDDINELKTIIYDYIDTIDELTYFKIQYREWFYYAKQKNHIVKNNPKIFENDIYNPILSSTYHKDSILEKCISSKNAFKEVERSQSPLSHSNKTNLILIYIQACLYGTMLTNIFPFISNYFDLCIESEYKSLFIVPLIVTYIGYLFPFTLFIYINYIDPNNIFMKISYIISYLLILLSSFLLFFVKNDKSYTISNFVLILISRILLGFANNRMMNKKYITLYLPKFKLSSFSKKYLIAESIGFSLGPIITLVLFSIKEFNILGIKYGTFNCIGWYGFFIHIFIGLIHCIFFTQPLSNEFVMVKDESNISGNKYYQRSESEINRKQYEKEQKNIYRKTYKSIQKKQRETIQQKENENNEENLIIKNINKDNDKEKEENINDNIINTNNNLEEKLIDKNNNNYNNKSRDSANEGNNSLDVSTGGNIALTAKQQNMINQIEKVLEKRNEECNFLDMNQIPKLINLIITKEKNSFRYINQNLLLLFIICFANSMLKINIIFNYIYYIKEELYPENGSLKIFCLLILLLVICQFLKYFFIFPFYEVNYKFKIFMLTSLTSLVLFNLALIIFDNSYVFVIMNSLLLLLCNIIDICCACYLSFILSPEWKFLGKNVGPWINYIITGGEICGGIICMLLGPEGNVYNWVLLGISFALFICFLYFIFFTRIFRIKGITRVLRKSVYEINLDQ